MAMKMVILGVFLAISCIASASIIPIVVPNKPEYAFGYGVQDLTTGDIKSQTEVRSGDVVQGQYSLIDSDGTKRTVDYAADDINGFNAVVRKDPLPIVVAPVVAKTVVGVAPAPIVQVGPAPAVAISHAASVQVAADQAAAAQAAADQAAANQAAAAQAAVVQADAAQAAADQAVAAQAAANQAAANQIAAAQEAANQAVEAQAAANQAIAAQAAANQAAANQAVAVQVAANQANAAQAAAHQAVAAQAAANQAVAAQAAANQAIAAQSAVAKAAQAPGVAVASGIEGASVAVAAGSPVAVSSSSLVIDHLPSVSAIISPQVSLAPPTLAVAGSYSNPGSVSISVPAAVPSIDISAQPISVQNQAVTVDAPLISPLSVIGIKNIATSPIVVAEPTVIGVKTVKIANPPVINIAPGIKVNNRW